MPYTYRKEGNKYCVYNKNTGKKVGCTTGSIKKYLAALHANVHDSKTEQLKEGIKSLIKQILNEAENVVMRSKIVNDKFENVLNNNVGLPFDTKEKQTILFKQGKFGVKSSIQKNGTEIKIAISDMFNNNKVTILKKLKNISDPNTFVYAAFFTVLPTEEPEEPEEDTETSQEKSPEEKKAEEKKKPENKVYIKLSQPFENTDNNKLDILGDFFEQLELK
jgi:hypothetical protein